MDRHNGLESKLLSKTNRFINPEHLLPGTGKQNQADWKATNQQKKKPNYLPEDVKKEIAQSKKTIEVLAKEYNVSNTTVVNIRKKFRPKKKSKRAQSKPSIRSTKKTPSKKRSYPKRSIANSSSK